MNGGVEKKEDEIDDEDDEVESNAGSEDTVVLSDDALDIDDDDDDDSDSAEINIKQLVAKIEAGEGDADKHKKEIRRRLDEIAEQRRIEKELESTFNFNLDDDF